jgi:uncharacterized protein (TIGR01777 family)
MKTIALTGAGGLIGRALVRRLKKEGDRVVLLSRGAARPATSAPPPTPPNSAPHLGEEEGVGGTRTLRWDPKKGVFPGGDLEGIDALIHLAGEPLVSLRWTRAKKERILQSREEGTRLIARGVARMERPPAVVISASAVGYYGDRGAETLTEGSGSGEGFLAEVCRKWEGALEPVQAAGIRTVQLRTGFVLARHGGALKALLPAFRLGVGGRLGKGDQYLSWIDLQDEVGVIVHALRTSAVEGPINATAPRPVTNREFTEVLGRVLRRPTIVPLPASLIRLGLGEMGTELLLSGQRAIPEKALSTGYAFRFEEVEASLRHQLGKVEREGGTP